MRYRKGRQRSIYMNPTEVDWIETAMTHNPGVTFNAVVRWCIDTVRAQEEGEPAPKLVPLRRGPKPWRPES